MRVGGGESDLKDEDGLFALVEAEGGLQTTIHLVELSESERNEHRGANLDEGDARDGGQRVELLLHAHALRRRGRYGLSSTQTPPSAWLARLHALGLGGGEAMATELQVLRLHGRQAQQLVRGRPGDKLILHRVCVTNQIGRDEKELMEKTNRQPSSGATARRPRASPRCRAA